MKFRSLKMKVVLLCFAASVAISIVGSTIIINGIENLVLDRMEREMHIILDNAKVAINHLFNNEEYDAIEEIVGTYTSHELIDQFQISSNDLVTLYSSNSNDVGSITDNMCVLAVQSGKMDIAAHFSMEDNVFEIAMPMESGGVKRIAYAHLNSTYVHKIIWESEQRILIIFNATIFVVMLIAMSMLGYLVLRPIGIIKKTTELVIADQYDTRINLNSGDEFEELASIYNKMLDSIHEKNLKLEDGRHLAEKSAEERLNFLAHMSHEIRSPLNSIIGFTSLLLEKKTFKEDVKELKIIMKSCNHLLQIVNEILDISKYEQESLDLESKPYSIRQVVHEVDGMYELLIPKNVHYTSEVDYDVPDYFVGDAYRIKEIMINLISNAIKFTKEGEVCVTVAYCEEELVIRVKDSGIGIPVDKQGQIFDAFTQSDESTSRLYGGSGLGLAISKRLALHMGGDLTLVSDGVSGTTFILSLRPDKHEERDLSNSEKGILMVEKWLASDSLVRDILLDYIPRVIELGQDIKIQYENEDWQALKENLHKVKGTSGYFKMIEIHHLVRDFEAYLEDGQAPYEFGVGYINRLDQILDKIPETFINVKEENEDVFSPLIPEDDENQQEQDTQSEIRILVADDVLENRLLIRKILEHEHIVIETVASGDEAIAEMKNNYYDCILLDIKMPGTSGEDVLRWIKDQSEPVVGYIITLTANARREDQQLYFDLGCDDYLSKPIDKDDLRRKIASLK